MPSRQSESAHGEVQPISDTSDRDLIEAVLSVADEIKQLRLHLRNKDSKLSGGAQAIHTKPKFGSNIKPKKVR